MGSGKKFAVFVPLLILSYVVFFVVGVDNGVSIDFPKVEEGPPLGVTLYGDSNLKDPKKRITGNLKEDLPGGISSVGDIPPGYDIILYKDEHYKGGYRHIEDKYLKLDDLEFDDAADSVKVCEEGKCHLEGIVKLYEDDHYLDGELGLSGYIRNLEDMNFDDEVDSYKIEPGYVVTLYNNPDFKGRCRADVTNIDKLHGIAPDSKDAINSVRIWEFKGAVLYQNNDYEARSNYFHTDSLDLSEDCSSHDPSSIKVAPGYQAILYKDKGFNNGDPPICENTDKQICIDGSKNYQNSEGLVAGQVEDLENIRNEYGIKISDFDNEAESIRIIFQGNPSDTKTITYNLDVGSNLISFPVKPISIINVPKNEYELETKFEDGEGFYIESIFPLETSPGVSGVLDKISHITYIDNIEVVTYNPGIPSRSALDFYTLEPGKGYLVATKVPVTEPITFKVEGRRYDGFETITLEKGKSPMIGAPYNGIAFKEIIGDCDPSKLELTYTEAGEFKTINIGEEGIDNVRLESQKGYKIEYLGLDEDEQEGDKQDELCEEDLTKKCEGESVIILGKCDEGHLEMTGNTCPESCTLGQDVSQLPESPGPSEQACGDGYLLPPPIDIENGVSLFPQDLLGETSGMILYFKCLGESTPAIEGEGICCSTGGVERTTKKISLLGEPGEEGYCPRNDQCLVDIDGYTNHDDYIGGEEPRCIATGQVNRGKDHYCENGEWTSKTKFVALQLLEMAEDNDYVLFCDSAVNTLNNPDPFPENTNNFCVLTYDNKVIFGTSLNRQQEEEDTFSALTEFLNLIDVENCDNAISDDGGDGRYLKCNNNDKVFYNKKTQSIIYIKQGSTAGTLNPITSIINSIKDTFNSIINSIKNKIDKGEIRAPAGKSFLGGIKKFDKLYLSFIENGDNDKTISGAIESTTINEITTKNLIIKYKNFDTNICNFITKYNERNDELNIGCSKVATTYYVLAQGIEESDPEIIWKDLTAKLRPSSS